MKFAIIIKLLLVFFITCEPPNASICEFILQKFAFVDINIYMFKTGVENKSINYQSAIEMKTSRVVKTR